MTEVHVKPAPKRGAKAQAKAKKQTARDKGVPDQYLSESGKFRIGMDARYKSDLIKAALEFEEANKGRKSSDAHKALTRMGWTSHLDKSRASRAKKVERKAKSTTRAPSKPKEDEQAA